MIIGIIWLVFIIALLMWILGLALSWGGWILIFFVLALIAGDVNILSLVGKESAKKFGQMK